MLEFLFPLSKPHYDDLFNYLQNGQRVFFLYIVNFSKQLGQIPFTPFLMRVL